MNVTPCDWPVDYLQCGGVGETFDAWGATIEDPDEKAAAIAAARAKFEAIAVENLWNLTGRVFGVCPVELRPCRSDCAGGESTFWGGGPYPPLGGGGTPWRPVLIAGEWHNITCGSCVGSCSCSLNAATSLTLPGPVAAIDEVIISGTTLPPTAYRLAYGRHLIRTDGDSWPACQDLSLAPDAIGAFTIRYTRGVTVPIAGQAAAGKLAMELAKGFCGGDDCELPEYVQSLTRQGLQVSLEDVGGTSASKPTGVSFVDNWIASVNKPRPRALVRSVDIPTKGRVGGVAWRR